MKTSRLLIVVGDTKGVSISRISEIGKENVVFVFEWNGGKLYCVNDIANPTFENEYQGDDYVTAVIIDLGTFRDKGQKIIARVTARLAELHSRVPILSVKE